MPDTNTTYHNDPEKDEKEERRRKLEEFIFTLVDETEYADFLAGDMTTLIENGKQNKIREAVQNTLNRMGGVTAPTIIGSFLENIDQALFDKKEPDADDSRKEKEESALTGAGTDKPADAGEKTEEPLTDEDSPELDEAAPPTAGSTANDNPEMSEPRQDEPAQPEKHTRNILDGITDNGFGSLSKAEKTVQLDKLRQNVHKDLKMLGNELHDMPAAERNDNNPDYKALRENVRNDILLINALDKRSEPEFCKLFNKKSASLSKISSDIIDYSVGAIPIDDIILQNGLGTVIRSGLKMSPKPGANQANAAPGPSKDHKPVMDGTTAGRGKAMSRK